MLHAADPRNRLVELYQLRDPLYREVADSRDRVGSRARRSASCAGSMRSRADRARMRRAERSMTHARTSRSASAAIRSISARACWRARASCSRRARHSAPSIVTNAVVAAHHLAPLHERRCGAARRARRRRAAARRRSAQELGDARRPADAPARVARRALDHAGRARRRRRRRPRRIRRGDLPARHAVRAGADDAARAGRLVGRRQDRRSTIRSART